MFKVTHHIFSSTSQSPLLFCTAYFFSSTDSHNYFKAYTWICNIATRQEQNMCAHTLVVVLGSDGKGDLWHPQYPPNIFAQVRQRNQDCAILREAAECYWKCEVCMRGGPSPSWLVEGVRLIALIHRPALLTDRGEHSACFPMRHHHHHPPHQLSLNLIPIPMFTFVLHICPFYSVAKSATLPNPCPPQAVSKDIRQKNYVFSVFSGYLR